VILQGRILHLMELFTSKNKLPYYRFFLLVSFARRYDIIECAAYGKIYEKMKEAGVMQKDRLCVQGVLRGKGPSRANLEKLRHYVVVTRFFKAARKARMLDTPY